MFPFLFNSPIIEYPLSGDVIQDISPSFINAMKGVPEVEWEVVTEVASYGKQLGKLTEAVLALATVAGADGKEIDAVREIVEEVAAAKVRVKDKVRARAEQALADLKKIDPEGAEAFLRGV